jgi:hypothetical protein
VTPAREKKISNFLFNSDPCDCRKLNDSIPFLTPTQPFSPNKRQDKGPYQWRRHSEKRFRRKEWGSNFVDSILTFDLLATTGDASAAEADWHLRLS